MTRLLIIFISIYSICFIRNALCQEDSDGPTKNNVLIHFMDYKKLEFVSLFEAGVKESIANRLTDFCKIKENDCARDNNANYTIEDIGFYGALEKEKIIENGRFIIVKLFAKQDNSKYLSSDLLKRFVIEHRENIVKDGKVAIAYIDKELVYPARDNTDNYVIVSISCGFVVILVIFNMICLKKSSNQAKEEFLKNAKSSKEKQPFLKSSAILNESDVLSSTTADQNLSDSKLSTAISRSESFDQKLDAKSKRRKKHRSSSNGNVAGNVGSGIGSPRNLAEPSFDEKWLRNSQNADLNESYETNKPRRHLSNYSIKKDNEVFIAIERVERTERDKYDNKNYEERRSKIYITEIPDSKVAARLATTDMF